MAPLCLEVLTVSEGEPVATHVYKVVGTSFRQDAVRGVKVDDTGTVRPEPDNEHHPNALAVYIDDRHCGYIPALVANLFAPPAEGIPCRVTAIRQNQIDGFPEKWGTVGFDITCQLHDYRRP